jgi:hypothetical protein
LQASYRQITNKNVHLNVLTTAGSPFTSNRKEWLRNPDTWRIIEYECIEPVYKLLDKESQQRIEAIIKKHYQQQLSARSRFVPDAAKFYPDDGVYKLQLDLKHRREAFGSIFSLSKHSVRFFFAPSRDHWF